MHLSRHSRVQVGIVPSKHTPTLVLRVVAATSVVGSEPQTWQDEFSSLDDRKVRVPAVCPDNAVALFIAVLPTVFDSITVTWGV
jgi:hypothetical protein